MNKAALKYFACILFFSLLLSNILVAQIAVTPPYDTSYIDKSLSKYTVRLYTASKQNHFYLFHQKWGNRITFHPEVKFAAGLGFSINDFALDLGATVYSSSINSDQNTKGFNFIGALYGDRNTVDITFQINNGFTESAKDSTSTNKDITRNDIHVFNFGMNYNYFFNYRKYSFNAAFIGTQAQKKSAGSFMLGIFFSDISITGDRDLIDSNFFLLYNPEELAQQANVFSLGITGGYVYTLVLPYRFFLTASLTPGITFSLGQAQRDSLNLFKDIPFISPKLVTRNAIGYGGKKFYASASFGIDINTLALRNKNFLAYTPEKIKIVFGYRIK